MMNKSRLISPIAIGAGWIACTAVMSHRMNHVAWAQAQTGMPGAAQVSPAATSQSAPMEIRIPGTLVADRSVDLYAKVSGYVGKLNVDIGSRVHAGDVLLRID